MLYYKEMVHYGFDGVNLEISEQTEQTPPEHTADCLYKPLNMETAVKRAASSCSVAGCKTFPVTAGPLCAVISLPGLRCYCALSSQIGAKNHQLFPVPHSLRQAQAALSRHVRQKNTSFVPADGRSAGSFRSFDRQNK